MVILYSCMVIMVCMNLGNSLERTKNQLPNEERFNFFDAELLQVLNRKEHKNFLVSPISIKLLLGMLMEGAEDKTSDEIQTALRLPDEIEGRRKEFNTWLSALQTNDSSNILKIANRIFLSHRYSINPDYAKTLQKYYSGGVTTVDFENIKETSKLINTWIGNETSQFIPSIVEEGRITSDNKLMMASAVYFKGIWKTPFASERSSIKCFYTQDNQCKDSLMMMETGYFDYGYISKLDAKAILLPYKGGNFSMLLLLPSKKGRIELLGRDLVHVNLASILSELNEQEVFVQIPQFEISYNEDLVESLKNVQIIEMFTQNANFSKIFSPQFESGSVAHIYHSAKITVNEEGSEAAAATGALFVPLMGGTTTSFIANHPFLFFVMTTTKNSILFAGKVVSPEADDSKKRIFSQNNVAFKRTKTQQHESIAIPLSSHKINLTKKNLTASESLDMKYNQRGQPKFRSISPIFSLSSKETEIDENKSLRRTFISHPNPWLENEAHNHKKRGKTSQEVFKTRKGQESSSDDWRHHVLFFT